MKYNIASIEEKVRIKFAGKNRLNHILGVRKMALKLAGDFNLDKEKVEVAALLHDYTKYEPLERQIELINDQYIVERFKDAKEIYHAYSAANLIQEEFDIHDETIINMIRYHVYGRIDMNIYEKILVLSDYIEETRTYPRCVECRQLLEEKGFDYALYFCIKSMMDYLISVGIKPMEEQYLILEQLERLI